MLTSHAAMKDRNRMGFKDLYVGYTAITKALWLKHFPKEDENWYIQYNMSCIVDFSESWACVHRFHTSLSCRKHQINILKDKKEQIQELFATTGGGKQWHGLIAENGSVYLVHSQPVLSAAVALRVKVFLSITYSTQLRAVDEEARLNSTMSPWILLSYHR